MERLPWKGCHCKQKQAQEVPKVHFRFDLLPEPKLYFAAGALAILAPYHSRARFTCLIQGRTVGTENCTGRPLRRKRHIAIVDLRQRVFVFEYAKYTHQQQN